VSVTTDGFISNLQVLESKLMSIPAKDTRLLRKYRELREKLSGQADGLEIKSEGKGIIS
jgi:hypothetical protein